MLEDPETATKLREVHRFTATPPCCIQPGLRAVQTNTKLLHQKDQQESIVCDAVAWGNNERLSRIREETWHNFLRQSTHTNLCKSGHKLTPQFMTESFNEGILNNVKT